MSPGSSALLRQCEDVIMGRRAIEGLPHHSIHTEVSPGYKFPWIVLDPVVADSIEDTLRAIMLIIHGHRVGRHTDIRSGIVARCGTLAEHLAEHLASATIPVEVYKKVHGSGFDVDRIEGWSVTIVYIGTPDNHLTPSMVIALPVLAPIEEAV